MYVIYSTQKHFRVFSLLSLSLSLFVSPFVCSRHIYPTFGLKAHQIFEPSCATCRSKRQGLNAPYLRSSDVRVKKRSFLILCFDEISESQLPRRVPGTWQPHAPAQEAHPAPGRPTTSLSTAASRFWIGSVGSPALRRPLRTTFIIFFLVAGG